LSSPGEAIDPETLSTDPAARRILTVPSEQFEATTIKDNPEAAEGANEQPLAVPALEKSEAVRPETAFEKSSEKERLWFLVGDEGAVNWAVAGPREISTVSELSKAEALPA
jgi:hypothetical protein